MNERDQIINFLLTQTDQKNKIIEDLQKAIADLQRTIQPKVVETT